MERRKMIFGEYDTALYGPWTLAPGWTFPEPEQVTNWVKIPGRDGLLNLSTALTDGEPVYNNRTLTATLECSEGDRTYREELIRHMVNMLDGRTMDIELPDDPNRYIRGAVSVKKDYNDLAHAAVTVVAECDPWRYNKQMTRRTLDVNTDAPQVVELANNGRRIAVPSFFVTSFSGVPTSEVGVHLTFGAHNWDLERAIHYTLPELKLLPGNNFLTYSGKGRITIRYQEAIL